jgi:hypothetical protein
MHVTEVAGSRIAMRLSSLRAFGVAALLAVVGCGYSERDVRERVDEAKLGVENLWAEDVANLFLGGVVKEDYAAARVLVGSAAAAPLSAADPPDREAALRDFVRGWLKEKGLDGARFTEFYFQSADLGGSRKVFCGAFRIDRREDKVVHFRLQVRDRRVRRFELSEQEMSIFVDEKEA